MKLKSTLINLFSLLFMAMAPANIQASPAQYPELNALLASSKKPAVIKFYAPWCNTCKIYEPVFQKAKAELSTSADFFSVNTDESKYEKLVKEFKVSLIPITIFVSKDRKTITTLKGFVSEKQIKDMVESVSKAK